MLTSKDVRVQGLMGPAAPVEKKNAPVSDGAVGMGGTNAWKLASLVRSWHPKSPSSSGLRI